MKRYSSPWVQRAALSWMRLGHSQYPQANSPVPSRVQQQHLLKPSSLCQQTWHSPAEEQRPQGSSFPAPREAQLPRPEPGCSPGTTRHASDGK